MSPTKLMDTIWHHHILDTKNYHNDCNNIFGFYLHHKPTFEEVKSASPSGKENLIRHYEELFFDTPKGKNMGHVIIPIIATVTINALMIVAINR